MASERSRVIFTGGSGKAGRHAVQSLVEAGHAVLNLDRQPLPMDGVTTIDADIADAGQIYSAFAMHFGFEGLERGAAPRPADAVVHFAAVPRILITPDNECFRVNVMGTYNVIEAAAKLGIRKIVIASSETTYGVCFAEGDKDFHEFPLTEDYPIDPMDSYGLSKQVNEETARAFAARYGIDIYALRIGNVIEPHEYDRFPGFVADPPSRKRNAWSYVDARDLGALVNRCLATDGLGFQVFNAVNDTITADGPTEAFLRRWAPGTPIRQPIEGDGAPISNAKAKAMLGFVPQHDWRREVERLSRG